MPAAPFLAAVRHLLAQPSGPRMLTRWQTPAPASAPARRAPDRGRGVGGTERERGGMGWNDLSDPGRRHAIPQPGAVGAQPAKSPRRPACLTVRC